MGYPSLFMDHWTILINDEGMCYKVSEENM